MNVHKYSIRSIIYFPKADLNPTVILLSSVLLVTLHRYFGSIEFAVSSFNYKMSFFPISYMFATAFILLGIIPIAIVYFVFNEEAKDYGICVGNWKLGLKLIGLLFPIISLSLLLPAAKNSEMISFYPFDKSALNSAASFVQLQFWRGLLFYTAWEFIFRGYILFGLRKFVGDWNAICIQTIPSCLWHIGMPTGEIFSSIAGGILFGLIALRTNSILWAFILHYLIGVTLDLLIAFAN